MSSTILRASALAVVAVLALPAAQASADAYTFDKGHTEVRFSWSHFGMSTQGARINDVDGTIEFNPADLAKSSLDVVIKTDSIATTNVKFDENLKSADFFESAKFPEIRFKSTSVKKIDDKTGEITGDLTIHGVTKPVTLLTRMNFSGPHPLAAVNPAFKDAEYAAFSATTKIKRSEFGVGKFAPAVSDEIPITIETELKKKK